MSCGFGDEFKALAQDISIKSVQVHVDGWCTNPCPSIVIALEVYSRHVDLGGEQKCISFVELN